MSGTCHINEEGVKSNAAARRARSPLLVAVLVGAVILCGPPTRRSDLGAADRLVPELELARRSLRVTRTSEAIEAVVVEGERLRDPQATAGDAFGFTILFPDRFRYRGCIPHLLLFTVS
jgi:hypothetical protein